MRLDFHRKTFHLKISFWYLDFIFTFAEGKFCWISSLPYWTDHRPTNRLHHGLSYLYCSVEVYQNLCHYTDTTIHRDEHILNFYSNLLHFEYYLFSLRLLGWDINALLARNSISIYRTDNITQSYHNNNISNSLL